MSALGSVKVLGKVSALASQGTRIALPGRRGRELLAALAVEPGSAVNRDRICAHIWPDTSDFSARKALNTELWRLRSAIKDAGSDSSAWIESTSNSVRLCAENGIDVDLQRFKQIADGASDLDTELLLKAVEMYRGDFASDLEGEWLSEVRTELRRHFIRLLEVVVDALRKAERFSKAFNYAERLIREEPFDERGHRALLLVQVQSGDHASAIRHYRELESMFRRELGISPSPETRAVLGEVVADFKDPKRFTISLEPESMAFDLANTRERIKSVRRNAESLLSELRELEKVFFK